MFLARRSALKLIAGVSEVEFINGSLAEHSGRPIAQIGP
jgi:hypothetical protein